MSLPAATLIDSLASALRPPPHVTPSQWAERNRVLTKGEASAHGPFRFDRAPFQREPLDCLGVDHPAQIVVLMWASGMGKSEAVGNNWIGYIADYAPAATIMAQPTIGEAEKYSKKRMRPLFAQAPLNLKVRDARERDSGNTILLIEFPGGSLTMVGANSPNGLSGAHICNAFADEIDRWNAGDDNDGDRLKMLIQRTTTYRHSRKILQTSTPTTHKSSRVEGEFANTDRRFFTVPCPHCDEFQILKWKAGEFSPLFRHLAGGPWDNAKGGVVWDPEKPGEAKYQCAHCGILIEERAKRTMLARGRWEGTWTPSDPSRVGFHISAIYSPWVTWGELATEFMDARGMPNLLRGFVNLKLGECWDAGEIASVEAKGLQARVESGFGRDAPHEVPAEACVLTAGVDIQPYRGCFMIEVVAWGPGFESWSIDWIRIDADPTLAPPKGGWDELDALLLGRTYRHPTLGPMRIAASCVDTGAATNNVYAFIRPRQKRRVWAVKGAEDKGQPIWPDKVSKNKSIKVDLREVNSGQAKEDIYWWLRNGQPGAGLCHFPKGRESDYFDELTAETLALDVRRGRARKRWTITSGRRNEALDTRVYAYAALLGLIRQGAIKLRAPKISRAAAVRASQTEIDDTPAIPQATPKARPARRPAPEWKGAAGNFWDNG